MSEDWSLLGGARLALTVTVSCEPGFLPILEALAARVGEYVGCQADAAAQVARAVVQVTRCCLPDTGSASDQQVEINFQGNDHLLRVDLVGSEPPPNGLTFADAVCRVGGPDDWRRLVDRIEFGDTNGRQYCRLTRRFRDAS